MGGCRQVQGSTGTHDTRGVGRGKSPDDNLLTLSTTLQVHGKSAAYGTVRLHAVRCGWWLR